MMADIGRLKTELDTDSLARGYAGMTDLQAADSLNDTKDRVPTGNPTFEASEIFQRVDEAEFGTLVAADKQLIWDVLHLGFVNPWGLEATIFTTVFGGGSTTVGALQTWRSGKLVSRGEELGFGIVREGHVAAARAL
jgi:hypothetical protein